MAIDTFKQMLDYGLIPVILGCILWGGWKLLTFAAEKLFHEETGMVTKLYHRHLDLISVLEGTIQQVPSSVNLLTNAVEQGNQNSSHLLENLVEMYSDPSATFSTVKTNEKLEKLLQTKMHLANAILILGENDNQVDHRIRTEIEMARSILQTALEQNSSSN